MFYSNYLSEVDVVQNNIKMSYVLLRHITSYIYMVKNTTTHTKYV